MFNSNQLKMRSNKRLSQIHLSFNLVSPLPKLIAISFTNVITFSHSIPSSMIITSTSWLLHFFPILLPHLVYIWIIIIIDSNFEAFFLLSHAKNQLCTLLLLYFSLLEERLMCYELILFSFWMLTCSFLVCSLRDTLIACY